MAYITTQITSYIAAEEEGVVVTSTGIVTSTLTLKKYTNVNVKGDVGFISNSDLASSSNWVQVDTIGHVYSIQLRGSGNTIINNGTISGSYPAITLHIGAFDNQSPANTIINNGVIQSDSVSIGQAAIDVIYIHDTRIYNSGMIVADNGYAIEFGTGHSTLQNSGSIFGAVRSDIGNDDVTNTGTIIGDVGLRGGNDALRNTGTIRGDVDLGHGSNYLDSALGVIMGTITAGDGGNFIICPANSLTVRTGNGPDTIWGGDGSDDFKSAGGNDRLRGFGRDDLLDGGSGADLLFGGSGDDTYVVDDLGDIVDDLRNSGSGVDTVRVEGAFSFSLSDRARVKGVVENLQLAGVTGLEHLDGTGNAADNAIEGNGGINVLSGLDGDDTLRGGLNNDTLNGGNGDDELFGEAGNDLLHGGGGADRLDGGEGLDTASYELSAAAVKVALDGSLDFTGHAAGDVFVAVENLTGTNAALGDTLTGNGEGNTLLGLSGNDILTGKAGNDRLYGGIGADRLRGDQGGDRFVYTLTAEGGDTIKDFSNAVGNDDAFRFKGTEFTGNGASLAPGALPAESFIVRAASSLALDGDDFFIFVTGTRQLWYDPTGSNTPGDAVLIATLQAGATITSADIEII